jgi:hypothetical protein
MGDTPKKSLGNGAFFMVAMDPALADPQKRKNHPCVLKCAQRYSQPRIGKGIPAGLILFLVSIRLHCFALAQFAVTQTDIRP